jgi:hypothetical protein
VSEIELASLQDAGKVIFRMPANHRDDEPAPRMPPEPGDDLVLLGEETGRLPPLVRPDEEPPAPAPESIAQQEVPDAPTPDLPPIVTDLTKLPTPLGRGQAMGGGLRIYESGRDIPRPDRPNVSGDVRRASTGRR